MVRPLEFRCALPAYREPWRVLSAPRVLGQRPDVRGRAALLSPFEPKSLSSAGTLAGALALARWRMNGLEVG